MQAITFVSQLDEDSYVEHGMSWYRASSGLALTPGHTRAEGQRYRTFDPEASILRCFQCHSTGPLRLAAGLKIEPSELGVQCETCHGAAGAHAASGAAVRNPGRMTGAAINELCGGCHRKPAAKGDDTDWTNPWNTRHQPLYFAESACFRKSEGKLTCFTCHPPHQALSRDGGGYGAICSNCHRQPKHRTAVQGGLSCVSCHMPEVRPQPALRFANHWIGVYAAGKPLKPAGLR